MQLSNSALIINSYHWHMESTIYGVPVPSQRSSLKVEGQTEAMDRREIIGA
jgi:hypothetical protein